MELQYFATNRIPVSSKEEVSNYLHLCDEWLVTHAVRHYERAPITKAIYDTLLEGIKSVRKIMKREQPLEDLNILNYGNLGFVSQIIYDEDQRSFKLRLFADEKLIERGFSSTFEPMRVRLTSGPKSLGLQVIKEFEEDVDIPKQNFSFQDLEKYQYEVLRHLYDSYLQESKMELGDEEEYEGGLEELGLLMDVRGAAKQQLEKIKSIIDYSKRMSFKEKLRSKSKLFIDIREDFSKKFPEKPETILNTGLGILPWYHRYTLLKSYQAQFAKGSFGVLLFEESYLPEFKYFRDNRANFMEAELLVSPTGNYCKNIISLYPYTWFNIPELNELHESFFEDDEILQAMLGHELGEVVLGPSEPIKSDLYNACCCGTERIMEKRYSEIEDLRHKRIDEMMEKVGMGEQTKKLDKAYQACLEEILPKYESSSAGLTIREALNYLNV